MKRRKIILKPREVVKELREKKGWSQATLASITGIAVSNISNIERGISNLGEERAIIFATAFGVNPEFILFPNGFERDDLKPKLDEIKRKLKQLRVKVA